jgi:hypothetical protein
MKGETMIDENELRETLRHYAGPDAPVPLRARRRRLRPAVVAAVLLAVAAGAGALTFALTRSSSESGSGSGGGGVCAAALRFRGAEYFGNKLHGVTLPPGGSLGTAEQPSCEGSTSAQVGVVALAGIDPGVAIGRPDEPDVVYVARGRCSGFTDDRAFVACLRAGG